MKIKGKSGDYLIVAEGNNEGGWDVNAIDIKSIADIGLYRKTMMQIKELAEKEPANNEELSARICKIIRLYEDNNIKNCREKELFHSYYEEPEEHMLEAITRKIDEYVPEDIIVIPCWE